MRFRLRTLLIALVGAALLFGDVAWWLRKRHEELTGYYRYMVNRFEDEEELWTVGPKVFYSRMQLEFRDNASYERSLEEMEKDGRPDPQKAAYARSQKLHLQQALEREARSR